MIINKPDFQYFASIIIIIMLFLAHLFTPHPIFLSFCISQEADSYVFHHPDIFPTCVLIGSVNGRHRLEIGAWDISPQHFLICLISGHAYLPSTPASIKGPLLQESSSHLAPFYNFLSLPFQDKRW